MPNSKISVGPKVLLAPQIAQLEEIPKMSTVGFHNIADHMGNFSASFASGASRSTTIRERIDVSGIELGLTPLRADLQNIYTEINGYFKSIKNLVADNNSFTEEMEKITNWAMALEQDSFLPSMVDQIRGEDSEALEQQTLGAIIDSLMRQTRPLIQEMITSSQEAAQVMCQLSRHINVDLDISKHSLSALRSNTTTTLRKMSGKISKMDKLCLRWEDQAQEVSQVIFEMVHAMQYDDITAQRIAHVIEALEQAGEKVESGKKKEKETTARWFALVLKISNNQLQEIGTDLVGAVHTMNCVGSVRM